MNFELPSGLMFGVTKTKYPLSFRNYDSSFCLPYGL